MLSLYIDEITFSIAFFSPFAMDKRAKEYLSAVFVIFLGKICLFSTNTIATTCISILCAVRPIC